MMSKQEEFVALNANATYEANLLILISTVVDPSRYSSTTTYYVVVIQYYYVVHEILHSIYFNTG
jgi:hypothetical protein